MVLPIVIRIDGHTAYRKGKAGQTANIKHDREYEVYVSFALWSVLLLTQQICQRRLFPKTHLTGLSQGTC